MNEKYCGQQESESGYGYVCTLRGEHDEHRAMDPHGAVLKAWPVRKGPESYGTIWVCQNCMLHHANGECGCCHDDCNHEGHEPLSAIEAPYTVAMGMAYEEHAEACETRIQNGAPDDYECDCETNTYSTSQCEGCGSYLHGERHAMTLFKEDIRPATPPVLEDTPALLRRLYDAARDA